jgi:thioredoxin 1
MEEHMAMMQVTAESFEATVSAPGIVVLDFWASWCAPCRAFAPLFEAAAKAHPDITWGKVNTEEQEELASSLGIRSIPTVAVFRDGVPVFVQPGMLPAAALEQLVAQVRALDMERVRREFEAQRAGAAQEDGR